MADDPNRDLLPVREGSCIDTCRTSIIDHRERHVVCKLDRYELEDRYLRLLDEMQELKKLSNVQEDKIKRLATKLMRVSANSRSCIATALDFDNDRNRAENLELENSKLKDKISVLRNQILNHKILGRSSSRNRRLQICTSSGPTTCRSENGRLKSSSSRHVIHSRDDQNEVEKYLVKIEELESEKKEMTSRIGELEDQLANRLVGNQREKVAENVEFIRVWRQMKQQNEELAVARAANVSLNTQIHDIKQLLDEKTRNNKEISAALVAEMNKSANMEEQLAKAKNSSLSLREKDEEIKDIMKEMNILHQHNAELIALSSKYGTVELENVELKKKVSQQLSDHQSLKSAFSNEQANISALQAANEQLMGKLHELQKNIDSLTIQLKVQNDRQNKSEHEQRIVRTVDSQTNTSSLAEKLVVSSEGEFRHRTEICDNCNQESREIIAKPVTKNVIDREVQTGEDLFIHLNDSTKEGTDKISPRSTVRQSQIHHRSADQPDNGTGNLTREEILNLLEQAQINMPLDAQNAARIRQIESAKNYTIPVESGQRQRQVVTLETLLFGESGCL